MIFSITSSVSIKSEDIFFANNFPIVDFPECLRPTKIIELSGLDNIHKV